MERSGVTQGGRLLRCAACGSDDTVRRPYHGKMPSSCN